MTTPDGYMLDPQKRLVRRDQIKPQHILEDEMVRGLADEAREVNQALATLKARAFAKAADFRDLLAQEYNTARGGRKGNLTFRSYDGTLEMQIAVSDHLVFGPELDAAKELIDGCVTRWSEGADDKLRVLVDDAFQVNKQGSIDTHRVLSLRRLDIDDQDWQRAMEAIGHAMRVASTRTYVRFYVTDPDTDRRQAIVLDIAGV